MNRGITLLVLLFAAYISAEVVFTGWADTDFDFNTNPHLNAMDLGAYKKFDQTDPISIQPFMIARNRTSGMDMLALHFVYNAVNDTMFVAIQCSGICGDTDGDGNPGGVDPTAVFEDGLGSDWADLCSQESIALLHWNNVPQDYEVTGDATYYYTTMTVGVTYTHCIVRNDVQNWNAYEFPGYKNCLWPKGKMGNPGYFSEECDDSRFRAIAPGAPGTQSAFNLNRRLDTMYTVPGYKFVNPLKMFTQYPNATHPHIEYTMSPWSNYPEFDFTPGYGKMRMAVQAVSSATNDCCGEDYVDPEVWELTWDCNHFPSGTATYDECGVCGGDNSTCWDCDHIPNGPSTYDVCGVCKGDNSSCFDCDHIPNGNTTYDRFGICGGNGIGDCFDNPYGRAKYDDCGVCGGDGTTCACIQYLGYDLPDVDYALLRWTVTANILKIQDTLNVLEKIKYELPAYDYSSGELALHQYIDTIHHFCDHCLDHFDNVQMWFAEYLSGACDGLNCESPLNQTAYTGSPLETKWTL